jgi:regulator of protease activity HflC (stomatin/prohibitin superfamily)
MTQSSANPPAKAYAKPITGHISLGSGLRTLITFLLIIPLGLVTFASQFSGGEPNPGGVVAFFLISAAWNFLVSGVRVAAQWERAVILFLGNLRTVRGPGVFYVIPVLEYARFVDTRTSVTNIPRQRVITRDNVPAQIDGAIFFKVANPNRAITAIEDYQFAIAQSAQATLRDVVGGMTLDELLSEREQIQTHIVQNIEQQVREWGLHVDSVQLQDIELPEDLKRVMSRQASAEREKRATITKAEGDKLAAENLSAAAALMSENPISLELRTLQTIDGLGTSPSNTVILFPVELMNLVRQLNLGKSNHSNGDANGS